MQYPTSCRPLAVLLALVLPAVVVPASHAAGATTGTGSSGTGCGAPLLAAPRPAAEVRSRRPDVFAEAVARAERGGPSGLRRLADDPTLWLDRCAVPFFVEADVDGAAADGAPAEAAALPPGTDVLALESDPGAPLTIYLDFLGESVSDTAWNDSYGSSLVAAPMSLDDQVDTDFSADELEAIHQAWLVVSEDFAPFAVNVTTRDPGTDALVRSSSSDPRYGTRVVVTTGGPIRDTCGCGGVAYLDVFGWSTRRYQPAWVFADATRSGWNIGQAASHEVGHNLALHHDGTSTQAYYGGHGSWAPIMGSSYGRALSQWSRGEYAGAANVEDDLAILAARLPRRPDDHGDVAAHATALPPDGTASGLVSTSEDVDAFTFVGGGETTVEVAHPGHLDSDLDLRLTVTDAAGEVVGTVDPVVPAGARPRLHPVDPAFEAVWTAQLPAGPAAYGLLVEGVGAGDPTGSGYSDYGSLGRYEVRLRTGVPAGSMVVTGPGSLTVGARRDFGWDGLAAAGGTPPYAWSAVLPAGVVVDPDSGRLSGRVDTLPAGGVVDGLVTVRDADGRTASHRVSISVEDVVVPDQARTLAVDLPVSVALDASGTGPLTWSVPEGAGSLPPGLELTPEGELRGTPSGTGSFALPVRAGNDFTDAVGTLELVVEPRRPRFARTRPEPGRVGRWYADRVLVRDSVGTVRWRVTAGALPPGLRLRPARRDAVAGIVGRPERRGRYRFTVRAVEVTTGLVARRTFRVVVSRR